MHDWSTIQKNLIRITLDNFIQNILDIENNFDAKALKFIHYKSILNFLAYYDRIKNDSDQNNIHLIFEEYLKAIYNID